MGKSQKYGLIFVEKVVYCTCRNIYQFQPAKPTDMYHNFCGLFSPCQRSKAHHDIVERQTMDVTGQLLYKELLDITQHRDAFTYSPPPLFFFLKERGTFCSVC